MKGKLILTTVVLTLLFASCNGLTTSPTSQPSHTPAVALTATAVPTPTTKPTTKATVPPTKAVETPTVTPDIAGTVVAISQPKVFASYPSPDGQWRAEIIIYDCVQVSEGDANAYEQLKLIRVDTGGEKIIDSQLQNCGGLGAYGLGGLFWSPNSRYFYYTDAREGVPDGCGYWERPIIRLDVTNQISKGLGGGPLSPDGAKIATWQGQELVVWDISQGELARAQAAVPDAMPGPIAWSPDSQALVYLQTTSDCPPSGKSYVVRLDLPGLEPTLLLKSETPSFGGVIWDALDRIRLYDDASKQWGFDLDTGTLTPTADVRWRQISDTWWKYSFEVPASWLLSEPGMTFPDRLVFLSDQAVDDGLMKLDFAADPVGKPDAPDLSAGEAVTVANRPAWVIQGEGDEASGPFLFDTTVYVTGSEYRYLLWLGCAPPAGSDEETRNKFIAECKTTLEHILASFQIIP